MLIGVFAISIVALFTVLIATWAGAVDFGGSLWPVVAMTPYFGLPISFLLLFALLIIATVRRARAARRDDGV
ncbi:multidrug ABC transporter ATPase [Labedella endophytica]|uniref:Multidrug ABC transporter ATPase n=2 Tax=Labedella endophytica TaxID=1523160 RepID=A0A433JRL1_9MICO|nr:multidrug ABC transporter ATPase [Labedella endophytica]